MTKVKFCGLSRIQDIEASNKLMPDFVGFIFSPSSKRFITPQLGKFLKDKLDPKIKTVGVFVDETPEAIALIADMGIIDLVQLHGGESPKYIEKLRQMIKLPIIKAIRVKTAKDAETAEKFNADYILFDGGMGEGKSFNHELLKSVNYPYFLAGGLDYENVTEAIKMLSPFAVDVSSGIESDYHKDENKMAAFIAAVKKAGE